MSHNLAIRHLETTAVQHPDAALVLLKTADLLRQLPKNKRGPAPMSVPQEAVDEYLEGEPYAVVAKRHGISHETMRRHLLRYGLKNRTRTRPAPPVIPADLIAAYEQGASMKEVAAKMGANPARVRDGLVAAGITIKRRGGEGKAERNRLVMEIHGDGATIRQIAAQLGVSFQRIQQILKRGEA